MIDRIAGDSPPGGRSETGRSRLVFTSAGPQAGVEQWLHPNRSFDLWVADYGGCDQQMREAAELTFPRRDAKFPNLLFARNSWPERFACYEAVLVLDDDIRISGSDIDRLFDIRDRHDLWIAQPAFDPAGKISHPITRVRPTYELRFTSFVEVTAPVFRRDKLEEFLAVYDPKVIGYGVDWWFCEVIRSGREEKVAIVDAVRCINPTDSTKGGERSIDSLQSQSERAATWFETREAKGLLGEAAGYHTFRRIRMPGALRLMPEAIRTALRYGIGRMKTCLVRYRRALTRRLAGR